MDTDAVKHLEGNVSNDDIMGIEKTYCKHSSAAKKICGEHHLTMTQCNKKLDVRRKSKICSVYKPSRGLESISVVYPALNLRSPSGKKVRPGVVVLSSRMSKSAGAEHALAAMVAYMSVYMMKIRMWRTKRQLKKLKRTKWL